MVTFIWLVSGKVIRVCPSYTFCPWATRSLPERQSPPAYWTIPSAGARISHLASCSFSVFNVASRSASVSRWFSTLAWACFSRDSQRCFSRSSSSRACATAASFCILFFGFS